CKFKLMTNLLDTEAVPGFGPRLVERECNCFSFSIGFRNIKVIGIVNRESVVVVFWWSHFYSPKNHKIMSARMRPILIIPIASNTRTTRNTDRALRETGTIMRRNFSVVPLCREASNRVRNLDHASS